MLTLAGFFLDADGYGYGSIKIAAALRTLGVLEAVCNLETPARPPEMTPRQQLPGAAVVLTTPYWLPYIEATPKVSLTMFETTRLPAEWPALLNATQGVIVPCLWLREVFQESGVTVPVKVAPWGIDPLDWYPLDRSEHSGPYTFLWSGTPDRRKGWDLVYRAFIAAFGGQNPDVRLVLHFREIPRGLTGAGDANVEMIGGLLPRSELRALLHRADCFVFPSRGEGWGLPPREAAATGLPVIATSWGGLAVEIERWGIPLRVAGLEPAEYGHFTDVGQWACPDFDHLVYLLREVYAHRQDWAGRGHLAADWLARWGTWERTARWIVSAMQEVGA